MVGTMSVNGAIGELARISAQRTRKPEPNPASNWLAPSPDTSAPYRAIRHSEEPDIRAEIIALSIDLVRQVNAADGDRLEEIFRTRDLIGEFSQNVATYGLDISDFGDTIVAFWAVSWGAVHESDRPCIEKSKDFASSSAPCLRAANWWKTLLWQSAREWLTI